MTQFIARISRHGRSNPPPWRHSRRGVTLIEMIAVIAILAILAVVFLPSVTSLSKASSRRAAVTQTLSALDQTRAMALSKGNSFYFVLADTDTAWPEQYRGRSFAIYEEIYNTTLNRYDKFPATGFTQLPTGIAFKPDSAATTDTTATVYGAGRETFYCAILGKDMSLPCFKFNTLGGVDEPTQPKFAHLRLFEGYLGPTGQPVVTNASGVKGEEVLDVSLATGRAKREEP